MEAKTGDSFMMSLTSRTSRLETSFDGQRAVSPFFEVHAVLSQVSL